MQISDGIIIKIHQNSENVFFLIESLLTLFIPMVQFSRAALNGALYNK